MQRREFITLVGGSVATWPLTARAQQPAMPVVGFLNPRSQSRGEKVAAAFRRGLQDAGYEEGRNVAVEYRWTDDQNERLPSLAADLVARGVAAIVAGGGTWVAAKGATTSIPIIFTTGLDPVSTGMVKSINRPEANLTGATFYSGGALIAKQIELLRELVPKVTLVAMLVHPSSPSAKPQVQDAAVAARQNGVALHIVNVADAPDLDTAFAAIQADALVIAVDPFFDSRAAQVVAGLACRRMLTMYYIREFVEAGGLVSYGASILDTYRQAGVYAGRILAGAKPIDLPVVLPTKFELVINLQTAKMLGLTIPPSLLATADAVIE
jgi:putative tryptophan/tyrosine transport system substrate-binding protein